MGMFKRKKNIIKAFAYGIDGKNLKTGIQTFKATAPQLAKGGKIGFQKKSINQLKSPELKFMINMVSRSKPQLPFLVAFSGFDRLAKMNITPEEQKNADDLGIKHKGNIFSL